MKSKQGNWKIGAVSYLNTLPLVQGIKQANANGTLVFDLPSRLADQLARGELDVALIPSIEVFKNADYTVVSDACIACRGPVWSVKLMSRVPISQIQSLSLDEGSRTSVALTRLLLDQEYSVRPELLPLPIDALWHQAETDAVLIIGDRAMIPRQTEQFPVQIDLGQWWLDQTGLPFVFAMWAAGPGISPQGLTELDGLLSECRNQGVANAPRIAEAHASEYGLSTGQCRDYFEKYLHFTLGPDERTALEKFRTFAADLQFATKTFDLHYHDC